MELAPHWGSLGADQQETTRNGTGVTVLLQIKQIKSAPILVSFSFSSSFFFPLFFFFLVAPSDKRPIPVLGSSGR